MKAYDDLAREHEGKENAVVSAKTTTTQQLSAQKIEGMVKRYRTHRCAFDFDRKYINGILKEKNSTSATPTNGLPAATGKTGANHHGP